jgi:hypothetical protein
MYGSRSKIPSKKSRQAALHGGLLTPNDLQKRRVVSHLKIKIPSKKSRQAALRGRI